MKPTNLDNIPRDTFQSRHIGPSDLEIASMLKQVGVDSLSELIEETIPKSIRIPRELDLPIPESESQALSELLKIAEKNKIYKSYIGQGYVHVLTPGVILRNVLENPGWYTAYTPYQAEIAQGRLEALVNFQTVVTELTGLPIANASLLDEGTAAAEAMALFFSLKGKPKDGVFLVDENTYPQTLEILKTRAEPLSIKIHVQNLKDPELNFDFFGVYVQNPDSEGRVFDYTKLIDKIHSKNAWVAMGGDLTSLLLCKSPGAMGADVAIGSTQSFGIPMGYGGPHAAYFATKDEFKRNIPGRIVGISKDADGKPAIRLALQTREQHIRREKATSNICTAQVLLAVMAGFYAVYHGPKGLRKIAERIHQNTSKLAEFITRNASELTIRHTDFFQTLRVIGSASSIASILERAETQKILLNRVSKLELGVTLDESTTDADLSVLIYVFTGSKDDSLPVSGGTSLSGSLKRPENYLNQAVFQHHQSETAMLRYIFGLQAKDLSLVHSMIPLGSCTMKLNSTSEMLPVSWSEFSNIHPFAPKETVTGYLEMFKKLEGYLAEITGFDAVSLQPNAGSQGEYAGLLAIRNYFKSRNELHRNICLIPASAHGTNPASAVMAGFEVVVVKCDTDGNIDWQDLVHKAEENAGKLGALMVTYPSTHGVFEEGIDEICDLIHRLGGQVYMDGANMNAQVGLTRPGDFGPDVCHLNLHKTFCIPHGGGGPGMGPIGVKKHLSPHLPKHLYDSVRPGEGAVSSAAYGSASILPIPYLYIRMMGAAGLKRATEVAILNANYIASRLQGEYKVLYRGKNNRVAHECILDFRPFKESAGVEVEDVAKRLMDYGFHAPTVSFPVPGTMMIEPTESENLEEIDRFVEAMLSIREEIRRIEKGEMDRKDNPLKNAPHTMERVIANEWHHSYPREVAAFPLKWVRTRKFWPSVSRIDGVYGDRNLVCSCEPLSSYN